MNPFESDDPAYFVLSGCVCSYYLSDEREVVTEIFLDGSPVIPPATPSSLDGDHLLRCVEDTTLAISPASEIERLVQALPRFESVCRRFAEERLSYSICFSDRLRVLSPEERYLFVVVERPELSQRVPNHVLASYLGIAPETLSRVRKRIGAR